MIQQSPALRQHLVNIQNEIDAKKLRELQKGNLFNEKTFYHTFVKDMLAAKKEIIIYSPFVSKFRSEFFRRTLIELRKRNVPVFIFTRPLEDHDYLMRAEITCALKDYEESGAQITYLPGYVHEKLAIIDREILWEGSLNILSQRESREMMRRILDEISTEETMSYLGLDKKLAEAYKFQYERLYRNLAKNLTYDFKQQIRIFFTDVVIPIVVWCFTAILKVFVFLMKGIKIIFDLISFLYE
jgi:phosphatidylserine/phosphatidylglycerophosphate/cardiolipin synthase-like enzyme